MSDFGALRQVGPLVRAAISRRWPDRKTTALDPPELAPAPEPPPLEVRASTLDDENHDPWRSQRTRGRVRTGEMTSAKPLLFQTAAEIKCVVGCRQGLDMRPSTRHTVSARCGGYGISKVAKTVLASVLATRRRSVGTCSADWRRISRRGGLSAEV